MYTTDITLEAMKQWEIPTVDEVERHWDSLSGLIRPIEYEYINGILPQGGLWIGVDAEGGWIWAKIPTTEQPWISLDPTQPTTRSPAQATVPNWVRTAPRNWPRWSSDGHALLIRTHAGVDETTELLTEITWRRYFT
ncbi:hypothetical protein [Nocardia carnea]|uniref:hypothetical protein n=1 Tax=Nocardia carnea TaxID=37328 RepID=UPI002457DD81|nr:hypothetical protein [Nocardia carnea]